MGPRLAWRKCVCSLLPTYILLACSFPPLGAGPKEGGSAQAPSLPDNSGDKKIATALRLSTYEPRVGDELIIKGSEFPETEVSLFLDTFGTGKSPGPPPGPKPESAIKIGVVGVPESGEFEFKLTLSRTIVAEGRSIELIAGQSYDIWAVYFLGKEKFQQAIGLTIQS